MRVILFLLCGIFLITPSAYAWEFGDFVPGDVFEYYICDEYTFDASTALRTKCYDVILHVIDGFEMDTGDVWVLYIEMTHNDESFHDIILVDESFEIHSMYNKYIGDSLENTIFWMPTHQRIIDVSLEIGNTISGKSLDMVVTDFVREPIMQYYITSEFGDSIILRDDVYLPMSITINTSVSSFTAELNSMYNKLEYDDITILEDNSNSVITNHINPVLRSLIPSDVIPKNNIDENNYDENNYDENNYDENNYDENNYDENNYDEIDTDLNNPVDKHFIDESNFDENNIIKNTSDDDNVIITNESSETDLINSNAAPLDEMVSKDIIPADVMYNDVNDSPDNNVDIPQISSDDDAFDDDTFDYLFGWVDDVFLFFEFLF